MADFSFRKATQKDVATIIRLVTFARLNPTRLDWRRFTVAVDESGMVIGCVQRKPHRDGSVELASLVVDRQWRGKGVARGLIEAEVEDHSGRLYLMCRAELGELYQRFGFDVLTQDQMTAYFRRVARLMREKVLIMGRMC